MSDVTVQPADLEAIGEAEGKVLERIQSFRRRRPRLLDSVITMAHGAGGKSSAALVDSVFLEAFRNPALENLGDGALLQLPTGERLAFSTDSYVVNPIRFPGGSIGDLAVNGTVNDLSVCGARPTWLSAAFIIGEGLEMDVLRELVADMAAAAQAAGVTLVTGDTKVVPHGTGCEVYITTSGIGLVPAGRELGANLVQTGDAVVLSGNLGDHGMAVMLARGDLNLEADLSSDTAPVNQLVEALLAAAPQTRWMRDATRGGLGTVCNELAQDTGLAVVLEESALPVRPVVQGACDLLGIDPIYVANEGVFVAVVPAEQAAAAVAALKTLPGGQNAAVIGSIAPEPEAIVALRTPWGGSRIVDMLVGDPLPRIC